MLRLENKTANIYEVGTDKLSGAFIIIANEYLGQDTSSYDEELLNFANEYENEVNELSAIIRTIASLTGD